MRAEWCALKGHSIKTVLERLNPKIRGWGNYFRISVASETFRALDHWMFFREVRYVHHMHHNKNTTWKTTKYWGKLNPYRENKWVFGDKQAKPPKYLMQFSWFKIERHVLVKGNASRDDPALREYWELHKQRELSTLPLYQQRLAQAQNGDCPNCGTSLINGESLEEHHKRLRSRGGGNEKENLVLLHFYCQKQIHSGKIRPKDATGQPLLILDHEDEE